MTFTKRRDFLKWTAVGAASLPALPLLQSLNSSTATAAGVATATAFGSNHGAPTFKLALSRISPYYLKESALQMTMALGSLTATPWAPRPQIKDSLLEDFKAGQMDAALISPTFYKNFPLKASLLGSIPHGLSDEAFDRWLKSEAATELREEIYAAYHVRAIPLGAFIEKSGFYSRFADAEKGRRAGFHVSETSEKSFLMSPFEAHSHFQGNKLDVSHTLAHRQHTHLGLPSGPFYYHESRGLRSAASFELLVHERIWSKLSSENQKQLESQVATTAQDLKNRLQQMDHSYETGIKNLPGATFVSARHDVEERLRLDRQSLFEKTIAQNKELKSWQSRIV